MTHPHCPSSPPSCSAVFDAPSPRSSPGRWRTALLVASVTGIGGTLEARQALQFLSPTVHDLGNEEPAGSAAADFDGDGHLDVVVGCRGSSEQFQGGQLGLLRGTGAGLEDLEEIAFGPRFAAPTVADFDLDGAMDVAVVRHYPVLPAEIVLFLGDGAGAFSSEVLVASAPGYLLSSADFNGDGKADLVNGALAILLGNGDGTFGPASGSGSGGFLDLEVCDVNLDGIPDVAVGHLFGSVGVYLGDGAGQLVPGGGASPSFSFYQQWNSLVVGDVDGGEPDILWGTSFYFQTHMASGFGDGNFSGSSVLLSNPGALDLALADFDLDGASDVAVIYGATSQVLRGHGDGTFDAGVLLPAPTRGWRVLVLDADEDGRPDLFTTDRNSGDNGLGSLYLNATGPDTTPPVLTCPGTMSVRAPKGGPRGAFVTYSASATDLVDPAPTVVCTPPSGSFFPRGTTVVLCSATDASGNQSSCTFEVVVQPTLRRR